MSSFVWDLHHAIRRALRAPGMVAVTVLSLGLGIGATSSVFSLVDAIVLRPWPIRDPASLVRLKTSTTGSRGDQFSYPEYLDVSAQASAFAGLAAYDRRGALLRVGDGTELLFVNVVSENYFQVLGVGPAVGRVDFGGASGRTIVISHDLWQRRFGGDPAIVGKTIRLSLTDVTVLGVAPRHFRGLDAFLSCAVWIPRATWAAMGNAREFDDRSGRQYGVIGRLGSGSTLERAASQLAVVGTRLAAAYPATNSGTSYIVVNEARDRLGNLQVLLVLTFCIVGVVLLICCANVAGLLIVQAEARRREMAVRVSLGASRGRLMRLLMGESLLLAVLGAAAGLLLTTWLIRVLPGLLPPGPFSLDVRIETRVVLVTLVASVASTLLAGLVPARGATRPDIQSLVKGAEPAVSYGTRRMSLRDVLVVGQVTLSFVLLAVAALLVRSFVETLRIDPGFDTSRRLLLVELAPGFLPAERRLGIHDDLVARLSHLPDVTAASYARRFHLSGSGGGASVKVVVPGVTSPTGGDTWNIKFNAIGPDYLKTIGTRLARGRDLTAADRAGSQPVMLVSEAATRQFWSGTDPIGRSLSVNGVDRMIVGIVQDASINSLRETPEPYFYVPYAQMPSGESTMVVETAGDPRALMAGVRQVISDVEPDLPVLGLLTLQDQMETAVYDQKMPATLGGTLGLLGMFLAAVGLYGAVAYTVSRRAHDIGIRMALGATRGQVFAMVVGQGLRLAAMGAGTGAVLAFAAVHVLGRSVIGVGTLDPLVLAGPALMVGAVTLLASYLPARRAARMSPLKALRTE
jgi:predicted permease